MNDRRPRNIIRVLLITAAVGFAGSALFDVHGDWGDPKQAIANVCWILFLLSVVGLLVTGGRVLFRRRQPSAR
jgi:hypothetical protein